MKIRITNNLKKFFCIPVAGLIMVTSLPGCGSDKENEATIETSTIATETANDDNFQNKTKRFEVGEHIIVISIDDPNKEITQYEYHEGYKPTGISTESYRTVFGEAHILYVNEYPVKCYPTYQKDSELFYTDFGKPIEYEREQTESGPTWKEFNAGEHIISIPLDKKESVNYQLEYYEGYEPIGIASASYGKYGNLYGHGCILYSNIKKVRCTKDENGNYTSFGIPEEDTKVLQK